MSERVNITVSFITQTQKVIVTLKIKETGELRQKIYTKQKFMERLFQNELKTWKKNWNEEFIVDDIKTETTCNTSSKKKSWRILDTGEIVEEGEEIYYMQPVRYSHPLTMSGVLLDITNGRALVKLTTQNSYGKIRAINSRRLRKKK